MWDKVVEQFAWNPLNWVRLVLSFAGLLYLFRDLCLTRVGI